MRTASLLNRAALDTDTARLVALREAVQIVVTGRVDARGDRYRLSPAR